MVPGPGRCTLAALPSSGLAWLHTVGGGGGVQFTCVSLLLWVGWFSVRDLCFHMISTIIGCLFIHGGAQENQMLPIGPDEESKLEAFWFKVEVFWFKVGPGVRC